MDSLNDPRGAIGALNYALERSPRASYIEDAMARLVTAYDAIGDLDRCDSARTRYLDRYPEGVHRAALSSRCKPR
jgi:hypothetical protein